MKRIALLFPLVLVALASAVVTATPYQQQPTFPSMICAYPVGGQGVQVTCDCIAACFCNYEHDLQLCEQQNDTGACYGAAGDKLNYCTGSICHAYWTFDRSQCGSGG
jgi:hypothetical protein